MMSFCLISKHKQSGIVNVVVEFISPTLHNAHKAEIHYLFILLSILIPVCGESG